MHWSHYLAGFFAGTFMANSVPHIVSGISGDKFPTPFSSPSGVGLSRSTTNVVWGLVNLIVGYILLIVSKANDDDALSLIVIFLGVSWTAIALSMMNTRKEREKLLE